MGQGGHDRDIVNVGVILAAQRAAGVPWAIAWRRALGSIRGLNSEARTSRDALIATRGAWHSAYEGRSVYGGPECARLLAALEREPGERSRVVERW